MKMFLKTTKLYIKAALKSLCILGVLCAFTTAPAHLSASKVGHFFNQVGDTFKNLTKLGKKGLSQLQHQIDHTMKDTMHKIKHGMTKAAYKTGDIAKDAAHGVKVAAKATAKGLKTAAEYTYHHRDDIGHGLETAWNKTGDFVNSPQFQAGMQIAEIAAPMVAG